MGDDALGDERVKHLEFIQAVISRHGNSSFLIKGWALTVESVFFALAAGRVDWKIALVAFVPLLSFWLLDAYYLRQERLFRRLYDDVRQPDSTVEPFAMDQTRYATAVRAPAVVLSSPQARFYGSRFLVNSAFLIGTALRPTG